MLRLFFLATLAVSLSVAASALAQDALPPPPAPETEPTLAQPDDAEPVPDAEPEPQQAPAAVPDPAPTPATERRYDGQVSPPAGEAGQGGDGSDGSDDADPAYEAGYNGPPAYGDEGYDGGGGDFEVPAFSIRLDPFNWLIEGRLGLELEVGVWNFITVELVPVFVANEKPPSFDLFEGREEPLSQESNGLGAISGASLGVGFWLQGTPFRGYVLRAVLTNYGYTYHSRVGGVEIDSVDAVERRLVGFIGSYSRFGFFTIGGGLGLGYALTQEQRCFANGEPVDSGCPDDELQIDTGSGVADLNGSLHPVYLEARLSLGVAFD